MLNRSMLFALLTLLGVGLPAAVAAGSPAAVVFSRATTGPGGEEGGLYAARDGRLNQLTDDPADSEPSFSADGRRIVFVREGDIYARRADGTGQHALTEGPYVDSQPRFAPNGHYVVFERRAAAEGSPRNLYTIRADGEALHALTSGSADDHEASFSSDGRVIVFVRGVAEAGGGTADDIYSVRPWGGGLAQLTHTGRLDEFAPRYFRGGIVFSRGQSGDGPGAYSDVYTMRRNGHSQRELIVGAGSASVEDVAPSGRLLLFRRDQGLWVKRIGRGRARKLTEVADGSRTNAVFSSDGRSVAAFVAAGEGESLESIAVKSRSSAELAHGFSLESGSVATTIGPVIAWQPLRRAHRRANRH